MHNNELANWDRSNSIDWSFFISAVILSARNSVCVCVCVCMCVYVQKQKQNPDTRLPPADQSSYISSLDALKGTEHQEVRTQINASLMPEISCIVQ